MLVFPGFVFLVIVFFSGSASSTLSRSQQGTMINLSNLLQEQNSSVSWNKSVDPCSWAGVTCKSNANTNSSVSKLSVSNAGLSDSSFLLTACQIDTLEALNVSNNQLSSIPDNFSFICGGIGGLKLIDLNTNMISGILPSFSNGFSKLEYLDLSHNALSGNIVMQLNDLVSLKSLNLSFNSFSGPVPIKLGKSMALQELRLSNNLFQGRIPEQFADYKNLTILDLSSNRIPGPIPSRIGELLNLWVLVLSGNNLTGTVPNSISNITTLRRFAANQNNFVGPIPSGISRFLQNLDLSFNNLSGLIPKDLLMQPNLETVDLSYNRLEGEIPGNVSSSLIRLRLSYNSLVGTLLPLNFGELKSLTYLELENNNLTGSIPSDIGLCQSLTLLNLAGNVFSGELPEKLGNLTKLQELNLQQNKFDGKIPYTISLLFRLSTLDLSWNSLEGSIPLSITNLTNLATLHLQGNKFNGSIPTNIADINSLTELQLGNNYLSGDIPSMPTKLRYDLNLSNNLFKGPIPVSFSELGLLEILDLSSNRFSGEIPVFLTKMQSLTVLLLDNNNLSGVVPSFGKQVKLDTHGNVGLIKPSDSELKHGKKLAKFKIVVPIAALAGVLVAVLAVFLSRKLLYRVSDVEDIPETEAIQSRVLGTNSVHKSNIDFTKAKEAVADPLNFVLKTKFSTYYKVTMPSGKGYFVKKLNRSDIVFQMVDPGNFGQELEALAKISNSSIMTPLAYMLTTDGAYIFYEASFRTTLFAVLHTSSGIPLDWASRCRIAVGVAHGLAYLHERSSGPILLFDLTSRTILLKSIKEPQIGDIELCKLIDPSKNTTSLSAVAGSIGYIPPEYAYTMKVTTAGNVYTFGVVLLELVTGKEAVSQGTELAKWASNNSGQPQAWEQMLDFSISRTSQAVKSQMLAVLKIAFACISASSLVRPKMKSVLRMLLNAT